MALMDTRGVEAGRALRRYLQGNALKRTGAAGMMIAWIWPHLATTFAKDDVPMLDRNEWGESIPEPNDAFVSRRVNPRNIEIEERRASAKPLTLKQMREFRQQRDRAHEELRIAGVWRDFGRFKALKRHYDRLKQELIETTDEQRRIELASKIDLLTAEAGQIRDRVLPYRAILDRYWYAREKLIEHGYARENEAFQTNLHKQMRQEVEAFAQIIRETWARLGYKHDRLYRNKRIVDKVNFSEIHVMPEAIWFKISVSRKTLGGFKSTLPYNVRVKDLTDELTLAELSSACQRKVTAKVSPRGAWIVVNRLNTRDGLIEYVTLEQVMRHYPSQDKPYLPIPMGVGEGRVISWVQLSRHPHFLIGGSTGGGKSNAINVIICTLITKHSPQEVQFVLVDLKEGLEFQTFENIPHLLMPVVKEVDQASEVLLQMEAFRSERAMKLAAARVKDIDAYNVLAKARGLETMPRVVVIFDEYAAIQVSRDYETSIQASVMQLLNKGRACGIHLIICTQNPSVDVLPGPSKANMAFRLAGVMPTQAASMTILGVGDAANLPASIRGRMIAMVGAVRWQVQTPHVRSSDLDFALEAAEQWRENAIALDTSKVVLPESRGALRFTRDDLLSMIMDNCAGRVSQTALWDMLKDAGVITQTELRNMIKRLIDNDRDFEYQGVRYHFKKVRKIYEAVEVEEASDEAESVET